MEFEAAKLDVQAAIRELEICDELSVAERWWKRLGECGVDIQAGPLPAGLDEGWSYRQMYGDARGANACRGDLRLFELTYSARPGWRAVLGEWELPLSKAAERGLGCVALTHLGLHLPGLGRSPAGGAQTDCNVQVAAVLGWWKAWLESDGGPAGKMDAMARSLWWNLAMVLGRNRQYKESAECLRRVADCAENDYRRLEALVWLASTLVTSGKCQEALEVVAEATAEPYRDGRLFTELLLWQGRALRDMGRYGEAEEIGLVNLRRSRALLSPNVAKVSMLFLGRLYLRQRRWLKLAKVAGRLAGMSAELGPRLLISRMRGKVAALKPAQVATAATEAAVVPEEIHRIAVARLDGLGDLVTSLPALHLLRKRFPRARIDLFVARGLGQIAGLLGTMDNVYEINVDVHCSGPRPADLPSITESYDLSIDMMYHARAHQGALMRAISARVRLGHATVENLSRCDVLCGAPEYRINARDMSLRLLERIRIRPASAEEATPRLDLGKCLAGGRVMGELAAWAGGSRIVGIHPGAGWPLRKWYPENFAAVADHLAGRLGCKILVIGGTSDEEMVDQILESMAGEGRKWICPDLGNLAAVLGRLAMLVCNDSGPMHLAGALGVALTVIWGPGDYEQFGPIGSRSVVIRHQPVCAPCCQEGRPLRCGMGYAWRDVACLKAIGVEEVCSAAEGLMNSLD